MEPYINKIITSDEALLWRDYYLHLEDLKYVKQAIQELKKSRASQFMDWTLNKAAIITYARCFTSGLRTPLENDIFEGAGDAALQFHQHLMNIRNKHVAHSVNVYENVEPQVLLDYNFNIVGRTVYGIVEVTLGAEQVILFEKLVDYLIQKVAKKYNDYGELAVKFAESLPIEDLKKLEDGRVIFSIPLNPSRKR